MTFGYSSVRRKFRLVIVRNTEPPPERLAFLMPIDNPGEDLQPAEEALIALHDLLAPADGQRVELIVHAFTETRRS